MSEVEQIECRACGRLVDVRARVCPYCAMDPESGEGDAVPPVIEELKRGRPSETSGERLVATIRSRSGMILTISIGVGVLLLILISNWVDQRQRAMAAGVPPVPLTEVTDLNAPGGAEEEDPELPELEFRSQGDARTMETFVLEQGEEKPPLEPEDQSTQPPGSDRRAAVAPTERK